MLLVTCPDCGRSISEAATLCINYGRPKTPSTLTDLAPATGASIPPFAENASGQNATLPFFEVGLGKFIALSIATFGLYEFYWAYEQWVRIKPRLSKDISPIWRAVFGNLWIFRSSVAFERGHRQKALL